MGNTGGVYSLVSSAVLALDLVRHPNGAAVADVVDRALALTDDEVSRMRRPASEAVRKRVLAGGTPEVRKTSFTGDVAATGALGPPSRQRSRTLVQALSGTLVGGLEDLHGLLAAELEVPAPALQTAQGAVTVAWAGRRAALSDLAALNGPWTQALDPVPPALTRPSARLQLLLEAIGRRHGHQWQRTADAHRAQRGRLAWSTAMHEACWAAFEHDRLTDVARAQLAAARQLRLSAASTGEDAQSLGMAVTAAVQAICLEDLLTTTVSDVLLSAWEAGS
ncbi:MAG: hypothetical protein JWO12_370 [Frankiales bacterium]|nr:hypothetical protein [Frankiales bacterium]